MLDTDDVWLPHKLEKQLNLFADPEVGIVISDTMFFNETDERALYDDQYPPEGYVFSDLLTGYFVSLETLMLRKSTIDQLAYGFDADFSFIADFDLVLRAARISKLAVCKEVLAKWRVHEASDSWQSSVSFSEERERWLEKQITHNESFAQEYQHEISQLHDKNFLLMAINALSNGQRIKAIKLIFNTRFRDWRDYALLILCFLPLSSHLLNHLQRRRIKRLLR